MATRRKKKASPARHVEDEERERPHDGHDGAKMGRRPVWQGYLKLSLVNCPVALFSATSGANDIHFHMINPKTNNRVHMIPTDPDTGPIERADLVKGYEIEKNRYVIVTQDELDAVKLETTHTLDIERFVEATDIDRLFWNDPYYLVPDDKSGIEAYTVIRDALERTNRIALGRVVMHTRERLMALEPRGKGILVYSLRMRDEVVDPKKAFGGIPSAKPDHSMIEVAEKIIEQRAGAFEPEKLEDRYEKALRDLLRRKERGEKLVVSEPPERSNVIDLMDALRKSLKKEGRTPPAANRVRHRAKG